MTGGIESYFDATLSEALLGAGGNMDVRTGDEFKNVIEDRWISEATRTPSPTIAAISGKAGVNPTPVRPLADLFLPLNNEVVNDLTPYDRLRGSLPGGGSFDLQPSDTGTKGRIDWSNISIGEGQTFRPSVSGNAIWGAGDEGNLGTLSAGGTITSKIGPAELSTGIRIPLVQEGVPGTTTLSFGFKGPLTPNLDGSISGEASITDGVNTYTGIARLDVNKGQLSFTMRATYNEATGGMAFSGEAAVKVNDNGQLVLQVGQAQAAPGADPQFSTLLQGRFTF